LDKPTFLMNAPLSYSTDVPNNAWMEDLPEAERKPNNSKAMRQFLQLYHFIAAEAVVYVLPAPGDCGLQDLVFTANAGVVLAHAPNPDTVLISNFASPPRVLESNVNRAFFERLGYVTLTPPYNFEGEAELKHLNDNVYAGGFPADQRGDPGLHRDVRKAGSPGAGKAYQHHRCIGG
jgi:N-dimethylarginine dimethylaminohydrolase